MARDNNQERRNVGYINFQWNDTDKVWSTGGNYTNEKGQEFDLGYSKTGAQGLQDAIALIAKQVGPTLAGKGIPRKERNNTGGSGGGGNGPSGPGGY